MANPRVSQDGLINDPSIWKKRSVSICSGLSIHTLMSFVERRNVPGDAHACSSHFTRGGRRFACARARALSACACEFVCAGSRSSTGQYRRIPVARGEAAAVVVVAAATATRSLPIDFDFSVRKSADGRIHCEGWRVPRVSTVYRTRHAVSLSLSRRDPRMYAPREDDGRC